MLLGVAMSLVFVLVKGGGAKVLSRKSANEARVLVSKSNRASIFSGVTRLRGLGAKNIDTMCTRCRVNAKLKFPKLPGSRSYPNGLKNQPTYVPQYFQYR